MNLLRRVWQRVYSLKCQCTNSLVPYVLIGGGTASYYASLTIRARDPNAKVLIITEEDESPYRRSALSKELWWYGDSTSSSSLSYQSPGTGKRRYISYEADGFYLLPEELEESKHGGVALLCGAKAVKLDADKNCVYLEDGQKIEFGKCLVATGSLPLHKKFISENPKLQSRISVLGNLKDYRMLYAKLEELNSAPENKAQTSDDSSSKNVVIIGGGLLGSELAYSINRRFVRGKKSPLKITQIVYEKGVLADVLPQPLSEFSTNTLQSQGVDVCLETQIEAMALLDGKIRLRLNHSQKGERRELLCDHLIFADGAETILDLAENSGLEIDKDNGGIKADKFLHVRGNVWTAGDVCSFVDTVLDYRRRCTHWLDAQITGRIAGENMTSGNKTYLHLGSFMSMLGADVQICGIGDVDPKRFDTITVFVSDKNEKENAAENDEPRAVVFYIDQITRRVKGVLLFNITGFGEEIARKLIADRKPFKDAKEYAKLFELWEIESDNSSALEDSNKVDDVNVLNSNV